MEPTNWAFHYPQNEHAPLGFVLEGTFSGWWEQPFSTQTSPLEAEDLRLPALKLLTVYDDEIQIMTKHGDISCKFSEMNLDFYDEAHDFLKTNGTQEDLKKFVDFFEEAMTEREKTSRYRKLLKDLYFDYEKKEAHLRLINMGFSETDLSHYFGLSTTDIDEAFALHTRRTSQRAFLCR